jgi:5-methylcytosine-specific restriction endonuclease McrA
VNKKYLEYKNAGTCVRCGSERMLGKTRCPEHHKQHLAYTAKGKSKAISKGLCRYCLIEPVNEDKSMCEECLTKHSARQKGIYQKHRAGCISAYGSKCVCCGISNQKYLQLDHINNDGADHRKAISIDRGGSMYTWAFRNNFPDNLQLLCANCHQAKTVYGGCTSEDH